MDIPQICLIFAALMLVFSKMPLAMAQHRSGGYDNALPRQQQQRLTGWGQRALAAHQNMFEAFPLFAAAVLSAQYQELAAATLNTLALVFCGARVAYQIFYLANLAMLRSLAWIIGFGSCIALLVAPLTR